MIGFLRRVLLSIVLLPLAGEAQIQLNLLAVSDQSQVQLAVDLSAVAQLPKAVRWRVELWRDCDAEGYERVETRRKAKPSEQFEDWPFGETCLYRAVLRMRLNNRKRVRLESDQLLVALPQQDEIGLQIDVITPKVVNEPKLAPGQRDCTKSDTDALLRRTNFHRQQAGLDTLTGDAVLRAAARAQSIENAASGTLTHDGWFDTLQGMGYAGNHMAQNIASNIGSGSTVVDMWMTSSGHRENILSSRIVSAGIGCVISANGTKWWTENFGG